MKREKKICLGQKEALSFKGGEVKGEKITQEDVVQRDGRLKRKTHTRR